ncbi:twin-arginine translocation signal domain-containing protein [Haloferax sp. YSMS24]|uniref:twin-arginine translocation signal domain-containing protein n=1 Tax=Haloferax sp. YSMS24 TaxID=3388425 RepID=UPI00398D6065
MSSERPSQTSGLSRRDVLRRGGVATAVVGLGLSGLAGSATAGELVEVASRTTQFQSTARR